MDLGLKDKHILITGGSRGIGKAIAKQFVDEGAKVSIVGRTLAMLEDVKQELGDIDIYQADVTNKQDRENLMEQFLRDNESIDVLVNNAGGSSGSTVLNTELEAFYESFEYNYFSAVHLCQLAVSEMVKQGSGNIVNIASIYGRESGGLVTYNNAKAALISFTKSLANEVVKKGVNVNSIAPGSVYHEAGVWHRRMNENPEMINKFIENEIPAGRFGTPEEIAQAVVFLASDKASWIAGACVTVDGAQSRSNI
ncbi:SDR family oxidoreductase [Pseudogracilibacillus sp. SE30717A]|uniref:SDR family NAD(P)-dependent oxidoreductase n=1 Tax=Pseudogracilibacillus sp. SE30717A TaxID=3098293 RepID=UPI00300DFAF2